MAFTPKQTDIIETAEKLFAEKGFEATTVRDIAEAANINVSMISYYFGSKEKLMQALFELRTGNIMLRIESLIKDDSLAPLDKVGTLIDDYIKRVMEKYAFYKIMFCEQLINKSPEILSMINDIKKRNTEYVNELIKDGQKKGAFRKKIDVILMLNTMTGTVMQMMINKRYYQDQRNLQSLSEEKFNIKFRKDLSLHIKNVFKAIITNEP